MDQVIQGVITSVTRPRPARHRRRAREVFDCCIYIVELWAGALCRRTQTLPHWSSGTVVLQWYSVTVVQLLFPNL